LSTTSGSSLVGRARNFYAQVVLFEGCSFEQPSGVELHIHTKHEGVGSEEQKNAQKENAVVFNKAAAFPSLTLLEPHTFFFKSRLVHIIE
jgi:hypothetical protein